MTTPEPQPEAAPPIISFRVTSYYKHPRGQSGMTQAGSKRLSLMEALQWVLDELPDDAWMIDHQPVSETDKLTITIDWAQVPGHGKAKP